MNFSRRPGAILLLAMAMLLTASGARAAQAQKSGEVTSLLQAVRVVPGKDGAETFADASRAKAGEILEYRLTYQNGTAGDVRNLAATLPIPRGTSFLERSARPGQVLASLDGSAFHPVPLMRDQKLPDGTVKRVPVPPGEYRFLRWVLPSLKPGASATLAARVRILGPVAP